jgi:Leucine-rich repeat (LRR) protein
VLYLYLENGVNTNSLKQGVDKMITEMFTTKEQIKDFLMKKGVGEYAIHDDLTVDIFNRSVSFERSNLKIIPFKINFVYELNLAFNHIENLETIPKNVRYLNLSKNELKTLEGAPDSLIKLDVSWNKIDSLKGLKEGLKILDIKCNEDISFLKFLPKSVKVLDVSDIDIYPNEFHEGLEELHCFAIYENFKGFPSTLKKIYVNGINDVLKSLEGLPEGLERLNVSDSRELKSTKYLPRTVKYVNFKGCNITEFEDFPMHLLNVNSEFVK